MQVEDNRTSLSLTRGDACNAVIVEKLSAMHCRSLRLALTPITAEDKSFYCSLMLDPVCMQYIGTALTQLEAEQAFTAIVNSNFNKLVRRRFLRVSTIDNRHLIGIASINDLDMSTKSADIGRILMPCWQGIGFGSEISQLLIGWLNTELGVTCVTKHIRDNNLAAIQSAKKLGFECVENDVLSDVPCIRKYKLTL